MASFKTNEAMEEIFFKQISENILSPNIFETLEQAWLYYSERPLHTMQEIKTHNANREVGLFFELYCKYWLLHTETSQKVDECYLFSELSDELKEKLGLLQKVDLGIDLVGIKYFYKGKDRDMTKDKYVAVQCKFISKPKPNPYKRYNSWTVPWKKLATFQGLVARTGPNGQNTWSQHILMTNSCGVSRNRAIPKDPKGKTIARKTFEATPKSLYYYILEKNFLQNVEKMNNSEKNKTSKEENVDLAELRKKRCEKFMN